MAVTATPTRDARLLNRELSWLEFNARVLALAADESLPLLERVRACSYVSANLDEFFMVRVAGLMDQAAAGLSVRSPDGLSPTEALAAIRRRVTELTDEQSRIWKRELQPALADEGIPIGAMPDCEPDELEELAARFEREVFPVLTPLGVGPGQPFPFISPLSLSLGVYARDAESGEERFARVKVPEGLPRFLAVGSRGLRIPLERVIGHFLDSLFPGMEIVERAVFRVTRDADFELSDEADDLLEAVQAELRRRRFGEVVRLEASSSMSKAMLDRLKAGLRVTDSEVYRVQGPLDLSEVDELADLDRAELKHEPWLPLTPPRLLRDDGIFDEISRSDLLVHHPYESFAASFGRFLDEGATDRDVIALKTTVYRTSEESPLVPALTTAAERGKQSVCLVELKARFDEHRNIAWSRSLEQAGVHVVYGYPNLKIHAKTTLVVRREDGALRRYVHIGTGNYHSATARAYEDVGFFTADEDIAADVADLFNYLTGFGRPPRPRKLLVAPFHLRSGLIEEIRAVAAAGEAGRIRLKLNALTDPALIEELYAASQVGAEIDILARSICALRPGVPGLSDRIRVRSILGRFLEHSRVFQFSTPEREVVYIGSADLMPRNLDHRIEILVPVELARPQQELSALLDTALKDELLAWELQPDGSWARARAAKKRRPKHAQTDLMRLYASRTRRRAAYLARERS